jgi:hypothetical protein
MTRQLSEQEIRDVIRAKREKRQSVAAWQAKLHQAVVAKLRREMKQAARKAKEAR